MPVSQKNYHAYNRPDLCLSISFILLNSNAKLIFWARDMAGTKQVIIIGAGLGGMASAIILAARGYSVRIYEKNSHAGGKLNFLEKDGFRFDLGPSILSMPYIVQDLFSLAGKRFEDYVSIVKIDTHWRNFFENGTIIDLVDDYDKQKQVFKTISPFLPEQFRLFLNYSQNQFQSIDKMYFRSGADTVFDVLKHIHFGKILSTDGFGSMRKGINDHFKNPFIRDIFSYFAKYIGSSPYNAPGFLNLLPWIQYRYGVWYIKNGMFNLSNGMVRLLKELNVELHLNTQVNRILVSGDRVTGVRLYNGTEIPAEIIVSNMEVIPAYETLLHIPAKQISRLARFEPSCSGLVVHLGLDKVYHKLAHHNFFYSANLKENFNAIYNEYRLPDDPTIYVVAPVRTDPTLAPEGCDILKLLPHIPHINDIHRYTRSDYEVFKDRLIDKLERMGIDDLRKHIYTEDVMTPMDIKEKYNSYKGSIYGVVSDIGKNYGFKAPKQSHLYSNLFFAGGSVNPGSGMPMVILGGMHTGHLIEKKLPI